MPVFGEKIPATPYAHENINEVNRRKKMLYLKGINFRGTDFRRWIGQNV